MDKNETNINADMEYRDHINELLNHPAVLSMKEFSHHKGYDCLKHSLHVSYTSYKMCKFFNLDHRSTARGALLHDLFLYDWHITKPKEGLHGFVHPKIALSNAEKYFELNQIEKDIIKKHMWPLTLPMPRYFETLMVVLADKYCCVLEIFHVKKFIDLPELSLEF